MKKLKKFLSTEVKAVDGEQGTYWFTASTPARDRQGDVIVQDGWKTADFMKNPVILWAHNYYETPIGKATEIKITPESLSVKIQFVPAEVDEFAGKVERLVAEGYLKTVSVGFMVYKSEPLNADDLKERPEMKYGNRLYGDLLEVSVVPVPANPEALNENAFGELVARGFGLKQEEARSKFLPYMDEKGVVSERLLKASIAAALGARGGISISDADPSACLNHLYRIAGEKGIDVPRGTNLDLKKEFADVWHDELLDVINNAKAAEEEISYKLISGEKRSELIKARDAINTILALSVIEDEPKKDESGNEAVDILVGLQKDLSSLKARLH